MARCFPTARSARVPESARRRSFERDDSWGKIRLASITELLMQSRSPMSVDRTRLHIALQRSGRLADLSRDLLREAGLRIESGKYSLTARAANFPADLMFVRDDDIPTFVSDGVCEFGVVGQ